MNREFAITYGGTTVGGLSDILKLDGIHKIEKGYERSMVEFTFMALGTDEATFVSICNAVEDVFRKPYQDLVVSCGGSRLLDLTTTGDALDTMPTIIKAGDSEKDTARSRHYTVRIECGMAATTGAEETDGLREASIDVAFDTSRRRTVTISGLFTRSGGTGARAQYDAKADAYCASILSALGGTYDFLEEPASEATQTDSLLRFTRIYEELIANQAGGSPDNASIVHQDLRIRRIRVAPGDATGNLSEGGRAQQNVSGGTGGQETSTRIVKIELNYECSVDSEVTTDLEGLYTGTVKSWLTTQAQDSYSGLFALVEEESEVYPDENRITARHVYDVLVSGDEPIERHLSVQDHQDTGRTLVPLHDGNPLSRLLYQGPSQVQRTVKLVVLLPGLKNSALAASKGMSAVEEVANDPFVNPGSMSGASPIVMARDSIAEPMQRGLDGNSFATTLITSYVVIEYAKIKSGKATSPDVPAGQVGTTTPPITGAGVYG